MNRVDFDFKSKLKQLEESQVLLKDQLATDIIRMSQIVGRPLPTTFIPLDLIEWAENLFQRSYLTGNLSELKAACPRILKYLTVSSHLSTNLKDEKLRSLLFNLLIDYPRERPLSNLLLYYFNNFLSINDEVVYAINRLFLSYFKENKPRLALTQFYFKHNLNEHSSKIALINNVVSSLSLENLLSGMLPPEVSNTDFYNELLIVISSQLVSKSIDDKRLFWNELERLKNIKLFMVCISKYTLLSILPADVELCKSKAMLHVGDPSEPQLWVVPDKYSIHESDVELARNKIETWINQQFIAAFFQTMKASDRGDFWLSYVQYMERVQILGSRYFLQRMKNRYPSASDYLDNSERFKECGINSEACVFMHFPNHIIILFDTENKAGICRTKNDNDLPGFKYYGNVTSIIDGGFHKAYRVNGDNIYDIRQDGRLFHTYDWKEDFRVYLRQIVL